MNRKSAIAFGLAPIAVSAIGFVFTPVLSWWLHEDDMARFVMFQTSANFFALLVSLGLDQAVAREFHETGEPGELLKKVLQLVFVTIPFGILGLGILKLTGSGLMSSVVTAGMAAACVLMVFNRLYSSFIRMSGDGVAYAVDVVAPKVLQLSVIALLGSRPFFALTYDVVIGVFVLSMAAALAFEIYMARRIGRLAERPAPGARAGAGPRHLDLLRFSAPLVPGSLAYYAISASAIYIVGAYGDARELVTTSLAISVGGGVAVLQSVFVTMWTPFAYSWHARSGAVDLYRHIATLVTMGCALLLLASLFVVPYLPILFPGKYQGMAQLVVLVIVWNLLYLVSIVGSFGIGVKRLSLTSMMISLAGAVLSIGMSILATRHFGAFGALLSVLAAFLVTLVLNCEVSAAGWTRIVAADHYLMVGAMAAASVLFSLGYGWQGKALLAASIICYLPKFRSGWTTTHALYKISSAT